MAATPRVAKNSKGGVYIQGLDGLVKGLRASKVTSVKALSDSHRKVAAFLLKHAKAASPGKLRKTMRAEGTIREAKITISGYESESGSSVPYSIGTFMGATQRFGWYAAPKYAGSTGKQYPKWVGNQWVPGEQSGKPYHIGDALNKATDDAMDIYADEVMDLAALAFPIKTI